MSELTKITIEGFKSFRQVEIPLGRINVLIGANGAGKSNLISFFDFLHNLVFSGRLHYYVLTHGFARTFLYSGIKKTGEIRLAVHFQKDGVESAYRCDLAASPPDSLVIKREEIERRNQNDSKPEVAVVTTGSDESRLFSSAEHQTEPLSRAIFTDWPKGLIFQFNDTSPTSRIRQGSGAFDSSPLHHDGGNLASCLHLLQTSYPNHYSRIISTIRLAAPFFDDFAFDVPSSITDETIKDKPGTPLAYMLVWRQVGCDEVFGPHQLPDGLLRFMALTTLLLQPKHLLPQVIIVDEPELGLHPAALTLLASLIRIASHDGQIILATQSSRLVDEFEPEDILVVERPRNAPPGEYPTEIKRLDPEALKIWLDEYSLGELWEKNIFGGRP